MNNKIKNLLEIRKIGKIFMSSMIIWTKKKIKDVSTKIGSGATPRGGKSSYKISGIPLIRSLNVFDLSFRREELALIDDVQAEELSNVEVKKEDVLLNITGVSVCRCTSVPDDIVPARVNQHVSIIRADGKNLSGKYLKYVLVSSNYKSRLLGLATSGATRDALTKADIENFEIDLPSIETQFSIVSVLSAYDDLIENNEKRIRILEEIAQRIYTEWFVKFRFPGYEKVRMVDSGTDFGKIPEGWEIKDLEEVSDILFGYNFKSNTFNEDSEGVKVVRIRDILSGDTLTYTSEIVVEKYKIAKGDLLIGMDGIFHMGMWCNKNCYLNQRVARIRSKLPTFYIIEAVKQQLFILQKTIVGLTVGHLSNNDVKRFQIIVPGDTKILNKFQTITEKIINLKIANQSLIKTRDLLIPQLVTGKKEIKQWQKKKTT